MKPEDITQATDLDGRAVVGVRLSNAPGKTAWLYRDDYERIAAEYPGSWSLVDARNPRSYVRVTKGNRSIYVGRLVVRAPARTFIGFWDGDTLNLRSSNLTIGKGGGGIRKGTGRRALFIPTIRGGARA